MKYRQYSVQCMPQSTTNGIIGNSCKHNNELLLLLLLFLTFNLIGWGYLGYNNRWIQKPILGSVGWLTILRWAGRGDIYASVYTDSATHK